MCQHQQRQLQATFLPARILSLCRSKRLRIRGTSLTFLFLMIMAGGQQLRAQNAAERRTVHGKVFDKKTGAPVGNATVTVNGSSKGVFTGEDGAFEIRVSSPDAVLKVSYVGYLTQEVKVGDASELVVNLVSKSTELNDVVVTALGIQRTARSLSYSTQKLGADQLNEVRDDNFANTLSGKVAGLTVTSTANGPGGATRIVLRGNRSIQGANNALIVVDGVAIDNSTPSGQVTDDAGSSNGGQSGSDGISSINPDDIESVNILKGATGAALYGSRANNGVIIITTKKGRAGKMSVTVNSGFTTDSPMTLPSFQNEYSQGAGGTYSTLVSTNYGEKIAGQQVQDYHGNTQTLQAYPDNVKDFFQHGLSANNAVGVTIGTEKTQAYLSYANNYANGTVPSNSLLRHTFNARVGMNLTDRLSIDAKITYLLQDIYNKPGVGGDGLVAANVYRVPRSVNLKQYKTTYDTTVGSIESPYYWTSADPVYTNPWWTIYNTHHDEDRSRVTALATVRYKVTSWLTAQARASDDTYMDFITQTYANNTPNYARHPGGYYSEENDYVTEQNLDFLLTGNHTLGSDFKLNYNVGASDLIRQQRVRKSIADGLNVNNKFDLAFATALTANTANSRRDLQSVYGTAQLSFRDYVFLDATARNDWSSTLPPPYSYFYPSVGVSWVLSDMLRLPDWISLAKVRASYAQVGNDAQPYLINQTFNYIAGDYGGYIAASSIKSLGNLKPEKTGSIEAGTEWRFFKDRLGIDLAYYKSNSKNQLLQIGTPASSGYLSSYINAGNIQNSGIELMLTGRPVQTRNFSWDITVNYAYNKSKVVELDPSIKYIYLGSNQNVRVATPVVTKGGQFGDLYGYQWERLNGKLVVDSTGLPVSADTIARLGNYNPRFTLGVNNSFRFKNWLLSFLVDGKFGGVIASGTASHMAFDGSSKATAQNRAAGSWTLDAVQANGKANTTAIDAEKFWQTVSQGDYGWGDVFTYNATNVRLRELSLGYEFTKLPSFLKSARFSLVGRNLFFLYRGSSIVDIPGISKRKLDFDPEASFGNSSYQGVEYYNLPTTRSIGVNLKLSF